MLTLNSARIDLWQFSLTTPYSAADVATLAHDEIVRAERFYFARHKRRFTRARIMLRRILAHYLAQPPASLVFDYNKQGKPSVQAPPLALEFNLSHSGELALLAVGLTYPLGVDVEFFSARPFLGISREIFSSSEHQALLALPVGLQPLGFFSVWSQKEALMKAMGLGLSYPTQHLHFPLTPTSAFTFTDKHSHHTWTMQAFMPETACVAALCYHPSIQDIRACDVNSLC